MTSYSRVICVSSRMFVRSTDYRPNDPKSSGRLAHQINPIPRDAVRGQLAKARLPWQPSQSCQGSPPTDLVVGASWRPGILVWGAMRRHGCRLAQL